MTTTMAKSSTSPPLKSPRILITYASIGSGHKAAANAIQDAIELSHPEWEISMIDTVETSKVMVDGEEHIIEPSTLARESKTKFLKMREQMPAVTSSIVDAGDYDWSIKHFLNDLSLAPGHTLIKAKQGVQKLSGIVKPGVVYLEEFKKFLKKANFDVIVNTHFFSAHTVANLKDKDKQLDTISFVVITDYHAHKTWKCRYVDKYFVPDVEVHNEIDRWYHTIGTITEDIDDENKTKEKKHKFRYSLGDSKPPVQVSGIPVSPKIGDVSKLDKFELRKNLGLPYENTKTKIVLATLTSESLDDCKLAWSNIVKWASSNQQHYVILIAGRLAKERLERDEHGLKKLEKNKSMGLDDEGKLMAEGMSNIMVVGFTKQMPEFMRASDVIISKPGGLTVSESLAFGLAWIIVKPWLLDVERPNADFLQRMSVAKLINHVSEFETVLQSLEEVGNDETEGWLSRAQAAAKERAHPEAAMTVVEAVEKALVDRAWPKENTGGE